MGLRLAVLLQGDDAGLAGGVRQAGGLRGQGLSRTRTRASQAPAVAGKAGGAAVAENTASPHRATNRTRKSIASWRATRVVEKNAVCFAAGIAVCGVRATRQDRDNIRMSQQHT